MGIIAGTVSVYHCAWGDRALSFFPLALPSELCPGCSEVALSSLSLPYGDVERRRVVLVVVRDRYANEEREKSAVRVARFDVLTSQERFMMETSAQRSWQSWT